MHGRMKLASSGVAALLLVGSLPAAAQESTANSIVLSGYATVNYFEAFDRDFSNFKHDFGTSMSPIFLFAMGDDLLFETELEVGFDEGDTDLALEYAQIDYLGFEHLQLIAGKFLLPFGFFSERLHPSWINKLPSMPLLYGHAHGGVAEGSLLPVLSDLGLMARFCYPIGGLGTMEMTFFVTRGPQDATVLGASGDGHAHQIARPDLAVAQAGAAAGAAQTYEIPSVAYGSAFSDNNSNKLLGGRLGLVSGANAEISVSGFHAMYDAANILDIVGLNVAAEWRPGPFALRGEGAMLWQEFYDAATTTYPKLVTPGYYVEASRRMGRFEPVARWSQLLDGTVNDETVQPGQRQLAVGLDYWIAPSVPVKVAYEWNVTTGYQDRILVQWAYGF